MKPYWLSALVFFLAGIGWAQPLKIGVLKYRGGGDWYANPTSLPNLIRYVNAQTGMGLDPKPGTVEPSSKDLWQYAFVHMTGHGNVLFSADEVQNLRQWMLAGGFLHVDDNYGMDPFIRREIKKLFPDAPLTLLPASHAQFKKPFSFPQGLPKIHEHDNQPPQAFGVFVDGRMVLLYTYESDLGNGWEDASVHGDSEETRTKALKMGVNLLTYVFNGER